MQDILFYGFRDELAKVGALSNIGCADRLDKLASASYKNKKKTAPAKPVSDIEAKTEAGGEGMCMPAKTAADVSDHKGQIAGRHLGALAGAGIGGHYAAKEALRVSKEFRPIGSAASKFSPWLTAAAAAAAGGLGGALVGSAVDGRKAQKKLYAMRKEEGMKTSGDMPPWLKGKESDKKESDDKKDSKKGEKKEFPFKKKEKGEEKKECPDCHKMKCECA